MIILACVIRKETLYFSDVIFFPFIIFIQLTRQVHDLFSVNISSGTMHAEHSRAGIYSVTRCILIDDFTFNPKPTTSHGKLNVAYLGEKMWTLKNPLQSKSIHTKKVP